MYAEGRHVGKSEQCGKLFYGKISDSDAWQRDSSVGQAGWARRTRRLIYMAI
jgi:hypothetical protein